MRLRWWALGGVLLVAALAAGLAYYFGSVPDGLARDHAREAAPEQRAIDRAMGRVYASFDAETFGASPRSDREIDRAKSARAVLRAIDRAGRREGRELRRARATIRRARAALRGADRDALFELPSAPGLDGRGKLADAERVTERQRAYMRDAEAFLDRYDRLIAFSLAELSFSGRTGTLLVRAYDKIAAADTPQEVIGPAERADRSVARLARRHARRRAPAAARDEQRASIAAVRLHRDFLRALAGGARALDVARIEAGERALTRGLRALDRRTRNSVHELLNESPYRREINRLNRLERALERAYAGIERES